MPIHGSGISTKHRETLQRKQLAVDHQSPQTIRERKVEEARRAIGLKPREELRDAGDQADHSAAEHNATKGK